MSRRNVFFFASLLFGVLGAAAPSRAGISALDGPVIIDSAAGDATFTVAFPHVPDFAALDSGGRAVDSFQIEIAANATGPDPLANLTTIIRGAEIRFANAVRVRNASPPDLTDPQAGAWGSLRGTVPFTIHGNDVTFTTPLSLLGAPNGQFAYRAFTVESGAIGATSTGQTIPLPPAWSAMLLTLGLALIWKIRSSLALLQ